MGAHNCGKEDNRIALRNTDYLLSGKSIVDKQKHENDKQKILFRFNRARSHTEQRGGISS